MLTAKKKKNCLNIVLSFTITDQILESYYSTRYFLTFQLYVFVIIEYSMSAVTFFCNIF